MNKHAAIIGPGGEVLGNNPGSLVIEEVTFQKYWDNKGRPGVLVMNKGGRHWAFPARAMKLFVMIAREMTGHKEEFAGMVGNFFAMHGTEHPVLFMGVNHHGMTLDVGALLVGITKDFDKLEKLCDEILAEGSHQSPSIIPG